jgi:hypothetical protein
MDTLQISELATFSRPIDYNNINIILGNLSENAFNNLLNQRYLILISSTNYLSSIEQLYTDIGSISDILPDLESVDGPASNMEIIEFINSIKIKCPLCRSTQNKTSKVINIENEMCPICLQNKLLFVPCVKSTSHILCCKDCYIFL